MHVGFVLRSGTLDAIFIMQQMLEKFLAKKQDIWMGFDRVPHEVVWWVQRKLRVDEGLVRFIQPMCQDVSTAVKLG
jgi:hypothetical protein